MGGSRSEKERGPSPSGCVTGVGYVVAGVLAVVWVVGAITMRAPLGFVLVGVAVFGLGVLFLEIVRRKQR